MDDHAPDARGEPLLEATFPEACIGFRSFRLQAGGNLSSTGVGKTTWRTGINLAYCQWHQAPQESCSCGLYCRFEPCEADGGEIIAAVACRGSVLIHEEGFRAEEAQIVAIALASRVPGMASRARAAAELYGVPLVALSELGAVAALYGQAPRRIDASPEGRLTRAFKQRSGSSLIVLPLKIAVSVGLLEIVLGQVGLLPQDVGLWVLVATILLAFLAGSMIALFESGAATVISPAGSEESVLAMVFYCVCALGLIALPSEIAGTPISLDLLALGLLTPFPGIGVFLLGRRAGARRIPRLQATSP